MIDELDSHPRNDTWKLVALPSDKKAIGSKWMCKVKQGRVVKCKARIVAQGYTQKFAVEFNQVVFAAYISHFQL